MFRIVISGETGDAESEREVTEFIRRVLSTFTQEGSPATVHNVTFEGSHSGQANLLTNPEPEPVVEEVPVDTEPKIPWDSSVPSTVPEPVVTEEDKARLEDQTPTSSTSSDASGSTSRTV